jgi:hypothetical protein
VAGIRLNVAPLLLFSGVVAAATGGGVALSSSSSAGRASSEGKNAGREAPKKDDAAAGDAGADKTAARAHRDAVATLERFAGVERAEHDPGLCTRVTNAVDRACRLGYQKVHVLLATVPDPLDSRFAKLFDDEVAAIRMALERSGFIDDRFYDPWRRDAFGEDGKSLRWREPGMLVFRRIDAAEPPKGAPEDEPTKDRTELLVLLLVGETPTSGVHRQALRKALDIAAAIQEAPCIPPAMAEAGRLDETTGARLPLLPKLPILGPAMSGSTESLRMNLTRWFEDQRHPPQTPLSCSRGPGPPFNLEIISGSATVDDNQPVLGAKLSAQIQKRFPQFSSSFRATVHPDSAQREFVLDYLVKRLDICRVAFLTEASTTYGEQFADPANQPDVRCNDGSLPRLVNLPFPLHISKLQNIAPDAAAAKEPSAPGLQRRLGALERDDDSPTPDSFPTKSRVTQSASEIALREVLDGIATEDVDAIVIVASSTADVLFLVERIRRSFPNVNVVVNDADIVFLHDDVPFMEGVLAASTYPLSPWTQRLSFPFEGDSNRLLFSSNAAEGTYNAALLLIDDLTDINVLDYSRPFAIPSSNFWPPQWMTVISHGTFWPLAVHAAADGTYLQAEVPQHEALPVKKVKQEIWTLPHSYLFLLANVLLALLNVLTIGAYVRAKFIAPRKGTVRFERVRRFFGRPTAKGAQAAAGVLNLFSPPKVFSHPSMQRFEVAALLLTVLLLNLGFLAIGIVTTLPPTADVTGPWTFVTALLGVITAVVLMLTAHAFLDWMRFRGIPLRVLALALGLGTILAIGVLASSRLGALSKAGTEGWRVAHLMFFIERARNLDSGMSVLWMAVLLAAGHAMWTIGHLRQVRIAEDAVELRTHGVIAKDPRPAVAADDAPALDEPMRAVIEEAEGVFPSKLGLILMVIIFGDALWISRHLTYFEHPALGWICAVAYALLLALIVFGCARYLRAWWALEDVLARVAPLPIVDALRRIPGRLLTSFKRPWDARVFEVWQRHCQELYAAHPNKHAGLKKWAAALKQDEAAFAANLLTAPLATQIEWSKKFPRPPRSKRGLKWRAQWDQFLAMRLVAFIQYTRTHLTNFIGVSTAAILPALWATNFYPLRQNRFLLMLVLAVAAAAIIVPAVVFVQMNRNYVLSRLARTSPGRVTWDRGFVSSILVHVAVPLLALLAVKFPELGRWWGAIIAGVAALGGGGSGG